MKYIISKIATWGLLSFLIFGLTSCLDEFDPSSYAPEKSYGGFQSSSGIEPDALVAYWAFDNSLVDSAGGLKAKNVGTTFDESAVKGSALKVGADHYLVFDDPGTVIPNLKSFTVAFWVNAPQNTDYGYGIFSLVNNADFWGNLDIYLDNGSTPDKAVFKVHMNNTNAASPGQFVAQDVPKFWNQWVHMTVTYDSSTTISKNFRIYKNGVTVASKKIEDYGALQFANATAMVIGTWQFQTDSSLTTGTGKQPWAGSLTGALDEFRIYDKSLSPAEVNALYKLEKAGR